MIKKFGLNRTEWQVMELLWKAKEPVSYEELEVIVGVGFGRKRRIQKLLACLENLLRLKLIATDETLNIARYHAICTREGWEDSWTKNQIRKYLYERHSFFGIYREEKGLSEEEVEELKKLIEQYESEET